MNELDENLILKYLQNECSDADLKQLNEWLAQSEENPRKLFTLEEALNARKKERFSSDIYIAGAEKKLNRKIEEYKTQQKKKQYPFRIAKYAAAIAVLIICGAGLIRFFQSGFTAEELIVSVSADQPVKEIELPDGTKVWINKNSQLKYPAHLPDDKRTISLVGEAYFEVTKDPERPFLVTTEALVVRVIGTKFNLKYDMDTPTAEAALIEGEIEVKGKNDEGQIVLSPGQKAVLNKNTKYLKVIQEDTKLDAVWHNDLIPFDKANIIEIAKVLERFYDVEIIILPGTDSNNTYSGTIPKKDDIESTLNSLNNVIPIKYKITDKKVFIQQTE